MEAKGEKVGVNPSLVPTSSDVEPSVVEIVTVDAASKDPGLRIFASFIVKAIVVSEAILPLSIQFSMMIDLLALNS